MTGVPLAGFLALAAVMFLIGTLGVVVKRNPIVIFMCIELMLNSANLTFLAFAKYHDRPLSRLLDAEHTHMNGQMAVVFVMAVAAAEVAIGLGIIMAIFRTRDDIDVDELNLLRG
jgi:NADH-quinone oxidoreductase subunit K